MEMWNRKSGTGKPLVMLHPGGVDSRAFGQIETILGSEFTLYFTDRRSHGHTSDVDGPLHFSDMVDDTIEYIESAFDEPVDLFGFSDGAIVAILLTIARPDLVRQVACASGVYNYDGWQNDVLENLSDVPDFMKQSYGEVSPDGIEHYDVIVEKMHQMHVSEPSLSENDLSTFENRCLVMVADDDEVRLEHALSWYRSMKNGELAIVPGTSHGMFAEKPDLFCNILIDFYHKPPVETFAPRLRKAGA